MGTGSGSEKAASCAAHASDDTKLVCTYTVASGDEDTDGVSVEANKLSLPSSPEAAIEDANGNDATLTHDALAAQSAHKVDAVAPTVTQAVRPATSATRTPRRRSRGRSRAGRASTRR